MASTTVSSKGQIVIPRAVRTERRWVAGTELVVEPAGDGVLLRPRKPFAVTDAEAGVGIAGYRGPRKTVRQIAQALDDHVRQQWSGREGHHR